MTDGMGGGDMATDLKAELLAELAAMNKVPRPREGDISLQDYMLATERGATAAAKQLRGSVEKGVLETEKVLGDNGHWRWVWRRKEGA